MYDLFLVRHGESMGNQIGLHQGKADYDLTEKGRAQARALAARWKQEGRRFDLVITSPLKRARQTAEIIASALDLPIQVDADWIEYDIGLHTGLDPALAQDRYPNPPFMTPYDRVGETGESRWENYLRAGRAVLALINRPSGCYLAVSHGGFINLVMYAVLGLVPHADFQGPRFSMQNTAFTHLRYSPKRHRWRLVKANDYAHLPDEEDDLQLDQEAISVRPTRPAAPVPDGKESFSIRPAAEADLPGLAFIHATIHDPHARALPEFFRPVLPGQTEPYLASFLNQADSGLFVAERDGNVIGGAGVVLREAPDFPAFQPRHFAVVDFIGVHPDFRRQGVARKLMEYIQNWARSSGAEQIELNVWEFNTGAVSLYEELGYSRLLRRMWKPLP